MPDHWPLRATKVATSILPPIYILDTVYSLTTESNKGSQFKLKLFFQKWYFTFVTIYLNIKINNQGKTLITDHYDQQQRCNLYIRHNLEII